MKIKTALVVALTALVSLTFAAGVAAAEERYPTKPIRLVVPYAPGGGSDTVARVIGQKLGDRLGHTVVVDARPGAASMIGTEIVAKARGDGHTLLLADVPHAINVVTYAKPTYDAIRDFAPVMRVARTRSVCPPSIRSAISFGVRCAARSTRSWCSIASKD